MQKRAELVATGIIYLLIISFWPLNFILHNSLQDTLHFFLPSILMGAMMYLFQTYTFGQIVLTSLIPVINSSLLFSPLVGFIFVKKKWGFFLVGFLMVFICYFSWKPFLGSSIFYYERNDQQKIIWQGYIYPHRYLARLFQNKPSIYISRFWFNFFALTDLGNYFFGYQPRPLVEGSQNLQKFPFLALPIFLIGLYRSVIERKKIVLSLLLIIINLSMLKYYDKTDAILWLPLVTIMAVGLRDMKRFSRIQKTGFVGIFSVFTITEYLHLFINVFSK